MPLMHGARNAEAFNLYTNLLSSLKIDLLHVHHMQSLTGAVLESAHQVGIPAVVTLHDLWMLCDRAFMVRSGTPCRKLDAKACARCMLKRDCLDSVEPSVLSGVLNYLEFRKQYHRDLLRDKASMVLGVSRSLRDTFREQGYGDVKIRLWPLGVAPVRARNKVPNSGGTRFSYIGNISKIKGVQFLLEACGSFQDSHSFHFFGEIDNKGLGKALKKLAEKQANVHFHGGFRPGNLPRIFSETDVAVFPSLYESYGLAVREALSAGLPVVASAVGGIKDIVVNGFNGILVEPGNVAELAGAIEDAGRPETRERLARGASKTRIRTIEHDAESLLTLYAACSRS